MTNPGPPTARSREFDQPDRWTSLNIMLHWLIVVLVALQFLDGGWMSELFDAGAKGAATDGTTTALGYLHVATGLAVFLAISIRLWDRRSNGRPPHPQGEPNWAASLARVTHVLLYALLLGMPVAGVLAWSTGNETLAELHSYASTALLVVLALHVSGAFANHFWFRTDVLRRMLPGAGRKA